MTSDAKPCEVEKCAFCEVGPRALGVMDFVCHGSETTCDLFWLQGMTLPSWNNLHKRIRERIRERERKAFESGAAFVNVQLLEVQDQMPPYRISEAFADWEREK